MSAELPDPPRPTDAELEILTVLWSQGASTVRTVHEAIVRRKPAQYATVLKVLQIMAEKGLVRRDGKETTVAWKVHLDDTTDAKMAIRDRWGEGLPVERKIDDAFGLFIDGIPSRVASSFREKL